MDQASPAVSQAVTAPLSRAAIFLVMTIAPGSQSRAAARGLCADLSGLVRTVGFRDVEAGLSCIMGIGSDAWDRIIGAPRPKELHPFREFHSGPRHGPATPGDVLFHIRSKRMDLCFELAILIAGNLRDAAVTVDEVHGFKYFDDRDLMGFVDGTENPQGQLAADSVFIGAEDPHFARGSYVIVQKYLHDLTAWKALWTEKQELVSGRRKLSDVELDDATKPTCAHSALPVIEENGQEVKI